MIDVDLIKTRKDIYKSSFEELIYAFYVSFVGTSWITVLTLRTSNIMISFNPFGVGLVVGLKSWSVLLSDSILSGINFGG